MISTELVCVMKVNEKIRFLRESQNWSQEEMANKLNMSTNGYSKIERGETRLTIDKLEKISKTFGVDILELMSLGEPNILLFQEQNNIGIINSSQQLASEIINLKQTITHKDEMLAQKDTLLQSQQREIELLRKQLD